MLAKEPIEDHVCSWFYFSEGPQQDFSNIAATGELACVVVGLVRNGNRLAFVLSRFMYFMSLLSFVVVIAAVVAVVAAVVAVEEARSRMDGDVFLDTLTMDICETQVRR